MIMDGNGRWAEKRGLPRLAGHRRGADALRKVVEAAPDLGVGTLTLYAFSADNWRRPQAEVAGLMRLFHRHLLRETARCVENGVRLSIIGRRDRLPEHIVEVMERAEAITRAGTRLHLRLAIDYSSRDAILQAAREAPPTRAGFSAALGPNVDLLIRTSGEQRLSDYLLWECAYAEMYFTPVLWPDFGREHLAEALREFAHRDRRFGGVPALAG